MGTAVNRIARLAAVAVLGLGLAVAAPATPAAAAACPDAGSGVTVVVDFAGLGGGVAVRCAPGDPASGLAALDGAGFGYAFVPRQPGLVCQLDGLPDDCDGPPPTDAHWSYWYAERGGSWQFSLRGAGSRDPAPGTVEGWAFGAADQPGVSPPAPPVPPPPPEDDPPDRDPPGDEPPADPGPSAGGGDPPADRDPSAGGDDQPEDRSPAGEPSAGASSGPPSPGAAGSTSTGGPATAPAVPGDPAARTTDEAGGAGGLAGLLVTATLVGALAAVGIWTARRRRRGSRPVGDDPVGGAAADG